MRIVGEKALDRNWRGNEMRKKVANLYLVQGCTLKEIAFRLGEKDKTIEYHWAQAKLQMSRSTL